MSSSIEATLLGCTLALYTLASALFVYVLSFSKGERLVLRMTTWATLAGFGFHTATILSRAVATGHFPVQGDYESILSNAWLAILAVVVTAMRNRGKFRMIGLGAIPLIVLLLAFGASRRGGYAPLTPAFRSAWLYVHAPFAWMTFGAYVLAFSASICFLLQDAISHGGAKQPGKRPRLVEHLPPARQLDDISFRFITLGFVSNAVMIVAGAFWANVLWGAYWSWDPVETWSLLTWLVYGLYIHLRVTKGWRGRKSAYLAIGAMLFLATSYWGIAYLSPTLHPVKPAPGHVFGDS